jgi:hypothetical protein
MGKSQKIILLLVVVLIATIAVFGYYAYQHGQGINARPTADRQQPSSTPAFSGEQLLAADQRCSQSAYQEYLQQGRVIEDVLQEANMGISYSDHFNSSLVKCYMKLDACYPTSGSCKSVENIYDVYDNQEILSWSSITNSCVLNLSGQACLSKQQYDSIVAKYFETTQQTAPWEE